MDESSIESSLETLNVSGQQQPASQYTSPTNDIDQVLLVNELQVITDSIDDTVTSFMNSQDIIDQFDINDLINPSNDSYAAELLLDTQLSTITIDDNELSNLLDQCQKQEPIEHDTALFQQQQQQCIFQSQFIECYDSSNFYPAIQSNRSSCSVAVGSSPSEPQIEENLRAVLYQQEAIHQQSSKEKSRKSQRTNKVTPVDNYVLHSGGCQPCTTVQMQNDYAYQQQLLEYNVENSKKILIHCQPRTKFRPRTQNESKVSAHYLRCEEGIKPEYPTIGIPQHWFFESDVNLIEVALMGVDKLPHLYRLDNKTSSDTFEDNALIFKQSDAHVLYFRLTNEDFQNGYKTLMMELIKSKQDDIITKEVIRTRKLEQSMLRFTRMFQVGKGNFQRDEGSTEYSTIMTEDYGDVEVDHMDPQYGPMSGQNRVYVVLKGRILKNELKVEIIEPLMNWTYTIESFTKNGTVLYFRMPAYPYSNPQYDTVKAYITVHYKNDIIYQTPYLYTSALDHALAQLTINDPNSGDDSSSSGLNDFDRFDFLTSAGARPNPSQRRSSTSKVPKRLNTYRKK